MIYNYIDRGLIRLNHGNTSPCSPNMSMTAPACSSLEHLPGAWQTIATTMTQSLYDAEDQLCQKPVIATSPIRNRKHSLICSQSVHVRDALATPPPPPPRHGSTFFVGDGLCLAHLLEMWRVFRET